MIERILCAAEKARSWLETLGPESEEERSYHDTALALCDCALKREPFQIEANTPFSALPDPLGLINLDRMALIELSRNYTGGPSAKNDSDLMIAHLATAFARSDDVQATVALLRLSETIQSNRHLLQQSWDYVLSQQQSDGSVGLLAAELALLKQPGEKLRIQMALTLEVLWAITAASCRTDF
jgi:hypothetical protein